MKHNHWCSIFMHFHIDCAPCRVRRLKYGYRLDPIGYKMDRDSIHADSRLTISERLWILKNTNPIEIEED